ncbi:hypothetical protein HYALB_00001164 [Hymenoscyphus albidus]|uniref:Heterokaryon incompatibility domain-containing protein n=1 Tax=Hymenoscyphus albidus TaxID=595503 RepID=A0A9N9LHK2_9HELO|nr:hypothetical protein HYALB_00001164 [Hymenoscyphus albidus]
MEFNLIVPVPRGAAGQKGDEEINGRLWRVTGPHDNHEITKLKFNCISYVWGIGVEPRGSFFDCKREISDQTRPALTAAMKAAEKLHAGSGGERIEAFWIDAICIPQLEVPARFKTLESMGFIYNAATTVLIVLAPTVFEAIYVASSKTSPDLLTLQQMQLLESDPWISRVWTYQELINGHPAYFTTSHPTEISIIPSEKFFNCVGFSLDKWKRTTGSSHLTARSTFPNLNTLEDTIGDLLMAGIFEMPALSILSNIALRSFDPKYPKNRLLACLGALKTEVSWGPPSLTMGALSEKLMRICKDKGDYSFIFTADKRMDVPGKRWRPNPDQPEGAEPVHLVPLINWYCNTGEAQRGHFDAEGLVLENLVLLQQAEKMDIMVESEIDGFLYGDEDGRIGVLPQHETNTSQYAALLRFFVQIGFKGCAECIVCAEGLFFPQENISQEHVVELFASLSLPYVFGNVGLARWKESSGVRYCAGIFIGIVQNEKSHSVRII